MIRMHAFILHFDFVVTLLITYQDYPVTSQMFSNDNSNKALHKYYEIKYDEQKSF